LSLFAHTSPRPPAADLTRLAYDTLGEAELEDADRDELARHAVAMVERVKRSAIWRRALASTQRLVEVPFETLWPVHDGVPSTVRGVIDLAFREPCGWIIVDYKTHPWSMERLVEEYGEQVRLYAAIWEKLVQEPVQEAGLYSTHLDQYQPLARR